MATAKRKRSKAKTVTWQGKEYPAEALATDWLPRLEKAFRAYQSTRARNAVYGYLTEVYRFAVGFERWKACMKVGALMVASKGLVARDSENRFG